MDAFQAARHKGYNMVSNIGVQMPNAPLGVPIAESYTTTGDEEALTQMQNPNAPQYYADTGGESTMMMSTPPAFYQQDPISCRKARQGGLSYSRRTATGPNGDGETQIRHNPIAPLPSKTYLPAMNLAGPGYQNNSITRPGL
jgi:hypothetical protein